MPRYDYACADCGHSFDIQQSLSDDALTVCPECDGILRKQYGPIGVTFRGGGFYRTDSRSNSKASSNTPSASPAATSSNATAPAKTASE